MITIRIKGKKAHKHIAYICIDREVFNALSYLSKADGNVPTG